jgi:hypothetical protein
MLQERIHPPTLLHSVDTVHVSQHRAASTRSGCTSLRAARQATGRYVHSQPCDYCTHRDYCDHMLAELMLTSTSIDTGVHQQPHPCHELMRAAWHSADGSSACVVAGVRAACCKACCKRGQPVTCTARRQHTLAHPSDPHFSCQCRAEYLAPPLYPTSYITLTERPGSCRSC